MSPRWALVLSLLAPLSARAQAMEGDTALARTYFDAGRENYTRGDYARALAAFEEAWRLRPLPELEYDIATCYEKLGQPRQALDAFQRYLDESPGAPNATETRARMEVLRTRLEPRRSSSRRRYLAPAAVGGAALALGVVGAALVGSVASPLRSLDAQWAQMPTPALQDRAWALRNRAIAGDVLLGVAGAVTIVDIALWVRAARGEHR